MDIQEDRAEILHDRIKKASTIDLLLLMMPTPLKKSGELREIARHILGCNECQEKFSGGKEAMTEKLRKNLNTASEASQTETEEIPQ